MLQIVRLHILLFRMVRVLVFIWQNHQLVQIQQQQPVMRQLLLVNSITVDTPIVTTEVLVHAGMITLMYLSYQVVAGSLELQIKFQMHYLLLGLVKVLQLVRHILEVCLLLVIHLIPIISMVKEKH